MADEIETGKTSFDIGTLQVGKTDISLSAKSFPGMLYIPKIKVGPHIEPIQPDVSKSTHDIVITSGMIDGKPVHNVHIQADVKPKTGYVGPSGGLTKDASTRFETGTLPDGKPYYQASVHGKFDQYSASRPPTEAEQREIDAAKADAKIGESVNVQIHGISPKYEINMPGQIRNPSLHSKASAGSRGATKMESFADINLDDLKPHLDTLSKKLTSNDTALSLPADYRTTDPSKHR